MSNDGKVHNGVNRQRFKWSPDVKTSPSLVVTREAKEAAIGCRNPHKSLEEDDIDDITRDYVEWRQSLPTNFGGENRRSQFTQQQ